MTKQEAQEILEKLYPDEWFALEYHDYPRLRSIPPRAIYRGGGEIFVADGNTWEDAVANAKTVLEEM